MNLEQCQEKLNKKYPDDNCKLLQYTKMKKPAKIKCLTCGAEYSFNRAENLFIKSKQHLCYNCFPIKEEARQRRFNDFINFLNTQDLFEPITKEELMGQVRLASDLVRLKCNRCGKINTKSISDYMKGTGCTCSCTNTLKTTEEFMQKLPEDIELLEEYKGAFQNIHFRHKKCGFCWTAKPHNILYGKGCPKCNRKISKGEQKIIKYLDSKKIDYKHEYPVEIEGHKLRIDFFLPTFNIGIEYNGIQHYEPVKHFGGESQLKKQQAMDNLKKKYYNIKEISYQDFDNIELILDLMFNDQSKDVGSSDPKK